MKVKSFLLIPSFFFIIASGYCQVKQDIANYIARYKDIAMQEMVRCKIPASVTLAQGLFESGYGKSKLTTETNNHFGIKCKDEWDGKKYYQNDDAPNECFRVYEQPEDSYADHSDFLITRSRYASLFGLPITDYKAWAAGLKSAGYATNPRYAEALIKTIEDNHLYEFDQQVLAQLEERGKLLAHQTDYPETTSVALAEPKPQPEEPVKAPKHEILKPSATISNTPPDGSQNSLLVNGAKVIKAHGTIDPLSVAFSHGIQYSLLLAYNDMNEGDKFKDGENIFLQSKRARASEEKYIVLTGESMHDISQKFGIRLKELYQKNMMVANDQPVPGETLFLQEKRTSPPRAMTYADFLKTINAGSAPQNNISSGASVTTNNDVPAMIKNSLEAQHMQYTVGPSDTLYSIAKRFNTTVQQLVVANNLQTADLHPGQTLVISK